MFVASIASISRNKFLEVWEPQFFLSDNFFMEAKCTAIFLVKSVLESPLLLPPLSPPIHPHDSLSFSSPSPSKLLRKEGGVGSDKRISPTPDRKRRERGRESGHVNFSLLESKF